jgi:hypothetical protein
MLTAVVVMYLLDPNGDIVPGLLLVDCGAALLLWYRYVIGGDA